MLLATASIITHFLFRYCVKLGFHGTDTDTDFSLGMRLPCIFVNVYTTAYRVQYMRTCVHARIPNRHPREETRVSDKSADK